VGVQRVLGGGQWGAVPKCVCVVWKLGSVCVPVAKVVGHGKCVSAMPAEVRPGGSDK